MSSSAGRKKKYSTNFLGIGLLYTEAVTNWFYAENVTSIDLPKTQKMLFIQAFLLKLKEKLELALGVLPPNFSWEEYSLYLVNYYLNKKSTDWPSDMRSAYLLAKDRYSNIDLSSLVSPSGIKSTELLDWLENNYPVKIKRKPKEQLVDLVGNKFASTEPNYVWCCDTTERGGLYITLIIDVASKFVVGSWIDFKEPTGSDMIVYFNKIIQELEIVPTIFHTDQGSAFKNYKFLEFLKEKKVQISTDVRHEASFGNNLCENTNNVLWEFLGLTRRNKSNIEAFALATQKDQLLLVNAGVNFLNDRKMTGKQNYSRKELYEALVELQKKRKFNLVTKSGTMAAKDVEVVHTYAVEYAKTKKQLISLAEQGSKNVVQLSQMFEQVEVTPNTSVSQLQEFLILMRPLAETIKACFNNLVSTIDKVAEKQDQQIQEELNTRKLLEDKLEATKMENQQLSDRVANLLNVLETEKAEREAAQQAKDHRRLKKANAKAKPIRQELEEGALDKLLSLPSGKNVHTVARDKLSLLLLCLFGLRIGQLRLLTVKDFRDLTKGKTIKINLQKDRTKAFFSLTPSQTQLDWFLKYKNEIDVYLSYYGNDLAKPFYEAARENLTRRLNSYFKELGTEAGEYYRSHSARVTIITKAIRQEGIRKAQQLVGHQSLGATVLYDRNTMTPEEQKAFYDSIVPKPELVSRGRGRPPKKDALQEETKKQPIEKEPLNEMASKKEAIKEIKSKVIKKLLQERKKISNKVNVKEKSTEIADKGESQQPKKRGRKPKKESTE